MSNTTTDKPDFGDWIISKIASLESQLKEKDIAIESFNRSESNLREAIHSRDKTIDSMREEMKDRYKEGWRDGYSQARSDEVDYNKSTQ